MACIAFNGPGFRGYLCGVPLLFRLPLSDGRRVYMEWRSYDGPTFYRDRACRREIAEWWGDDPIGDALDWFLRRGKVA